MSDYEDDDENLLSFEDLDDDSEFSYNNNSEDWGDSMDDMDAEAWDREYRGRDEEELEEDDPWALS